MSQQLHTNTIMVNGDDYKFATNIGSKIHRAKQNLNFMNQCQNHKILPNFTKISRSVIKQGRLSPQQILNLRQQNLNEAIQREHTRLDKNTYKFNKILSNIQQQLESPSVYEKLKYKLFNEITKREKTNDQHRIQKLTKLENNYKQIPYATVVIQNISNNEIPVEVLKALELGLNTAVGGKPNDLETLTEMDRFFEKWKKYAKIQNIPNKTIFEIRARLYITFGELTKCVTNDPKRKILIDFFKVNNHLVVVTCDKTKNLVIMTKDQYIEKIKSTFNDETKFKSLNKNPLTNDIEEFHKLLKKIEPHVHPKTFHKMKPNHALKKGYGVLKTHKTGWPMRPLVSSINSIPSGAEEFLLKLIEPIIEKCEYSINSSKKFKTEFQKFQNKFNSKTMEVLSFDAKSLYTNVCIKTVVNYIIKEIYLDPNKYFKETIINEKTKRENKLKIPKTILKNFFIDILTKFSSFSTLTGYFKQINGISMGSKLSPGLANIYCSIMENEIIKNFEKSNIIFFYKRYVDDVFIVCLKNKKNIILQKMNEFATDLKFTEETMLDNELVFLDMCIYINTKNEINIKQHRKPDSNVLSNFKKSIMPKSQKIGLLMGEIYRANNTTSTETDLNNAITKVTEILINNEYPEYLINSKIEQIKSRNFLPNQNKIEKETEIRENPERCFNLSLSYTHHRCQKVATNILQIIKNITPLFRLNICWKNIRLSNFFSPKLKLHVPIYEKNGTVYNFNCPCSKNPLYIGESKRQLSKRIYEHNRIKDSPIYLHIQECNEYQSKLITKYGVSPTPSERRQFIMECFSPICTNASNYYKRTRLEAIAITLNSPPLNDQVIHKKVSII